MKVAAVSITSKAACTIDMGFIRVVCSLLDFVRWIRFDVAYVLHPPGAEALYTASISFYTLRITTTYGTD